jgi:hypothetical protein
VISIGTSDQAGAAQPSNAIRRTGRLDTPSMPVSSSAFPALPPQPSWRVRDGRTRIGAVYMHAIDSHYAEPRVTAAADFRVSKG